MKQDGNRDLSAVSAWLEREDEQLAQDRQLESEVLAQASPISVQGAGPLLEDLGSIGETASSIVIVTLAYVID